MHYISLQVCVRLVQKATFGQAEDGLERDIDNICIRKMSGDPN